MREHPLKELRILSNDPLYENVRGISAGHHENHDGSGNVAMIFRYLRVL